MGVVNSVMKLVINLNYGVSIFIRIKGNSLMEANEFQREDVLNKAFEFQSFAVMDNMVTIVRSDCKIVLETEMLKGVSVVFIAYFPVDVEEEPLHFWMNKSSMSSLGDKLRASSSRRIPWINLRTKH